MSPLPVPPLDKHEIVRAVRNERHHTLDLLRRVPPDRFDAPTALPGWRVREVVAHLVTTDQATVTGRILPMVIFKRATGPIERWNDGQVRSWADRPVPDLLDGLERWGRRFVTQIRVLPAGLYRAPIRNPWGPTAGMPIFTRAFDEWVHRQDIRRALALPDESVDLFPACEVVLRVIGWEALPKLVAGSGRVALSLKGAPLPEWSYDLGTGAFGPRGDEEVSAQVVANAPAFVMAAAGRDGFDELKSSSMLTIEGDEALAEALLRVVRVV